MQTAARPAPETRPPVSGADPGATRPRWWRDTRRRRLLAAADLCAAGVASLLAIPSLTLAVWPLAFLPLWVVVAKLAGLYDRDHRVINHSTLHELPALGAWIAICVAGLGLLLPLTPAGGLAVSDAVWVWLVTSAVACAGRALARGLWRRTTPPELTAVIGEGDLALTTRRKIELFPEMHMRLAEGVSLPEPGEEGARQPELRRLGREIDRLIVATEGLDPAWLGRLVGICREEQVKLSVASPLRGRSGALPRLSQIADLPVLEYDTWDVSRSTALIKRAFDVVFAVGALVVLLPLAPFLALAIRFDSRGPVLFVQVRAGVNGQPFRMLKLRTMRRDAENELAELVRIDELSEPMFKLARDPRVTRVGRVLRRFSLDELPQLVNVLRGEMSIVGPRPEQVELVERYRPEHRFRLTVRPGMTGPMQVYGRGALTFPERLAVELDYVENLSLARDLAIMARTLPAVVRGTGAY